MVKWLREREGPVGSDWFNYSGFQTMTEGLLHAASAIGHLCGEKW